MMFFSIVLRSLLGRKKNGTIVSDIQAQPSLAAHPTNAADYAWRHPSQYATIYAKSNCGSYFEDRSLEDSILSLTRGLHVSAPITQEPFVYPTEKGCFR